MESSLMIDAARTMVVILGGLIIGYTLRKSGRLPEQASTPLNEFVLTYIQPFVIALALWSMEPPDLQTLALPIFDIALILCLWPAGILISRLIRMDRPSRGSFVLMTMFSNVGFTYGTFLAYVAIGPQGAALGALYCVSFLPVLFTVGFFVARRHAPGSHAGALEALKDLVTDSHTRNPMVGIAAGLLLSFVGIGAPAASGFTIDILMPLTTALFLVAIGLGLRLSAVRDYWRECTLLHGARFLVSPAIGLALAFAFGYWQMADHDLLKVVFIQSATPAAIMAVMVADIFDLNKGLAGALWITTNVTSIFLAPVILYIASLL
ncbi:MAG: AEC family transporter [Armatimonadota bacterium]